MKKIRGRVLEVLSVLLACAIILNNGSIMMVLASNVDGREVSSGKSSYETDRSGSSKGNGNGEDSANDEDGGSNDGSGEGGGSNGGSGSGEDSGNGENGGSGEDSGNGDGSGSGEGSGENSGNGEDSGSGEGSGSDENSGSGEDSGSGEGSGSGENSGNGEGSGNGEDSGSGENNGNGGASGSGEGSGNGEDDGSGENDGTGEDEGNGVEDGTDEETGDGEEGGEEEEDEDNKDKDPTEDEKKDPAEGEHRHTWVRAEGEIYPVCTECEEIYQDDDCDPEMGIGIHIFELIHLDEEDIVQGTEEESEEEAKEETEEETREEAEEETEEEAIEEAEEGTEEETREETEKETEEEAIEETEGEAREETEEEEAGEETEEETEEEVKEDTKTRERAAKGEAEKETEKETENETEEEENRGNHSPTEIYRCVVCGFEKEFLEEWDLTIEEYMAIAGIERFSFGYNGETSSLPTSKAELDQAVQDGYYKDGIFNVKNLADIMALQSLSQEFSFEDYKIQFVGREDSNGQGTLTNWDLTPLASDFKGLGTEEFPFKGTLTTFYANNSLRFTTATPLLNYVATGAVVSEFQITSKISGSGDPVGVIAAHVVADSNAEKVSLSKLTISGDVHNSDGPAGILFGEVIGESDTGSDTGSESNVIKLQYLAEDTIILRANVSAKEAGGIAGKVSGAHVEVYDVNCITEGVIDGSESSGMLIGTMDESVLCLDGDNEIEANVKGRGRSGGLVGSMKGGRVERVHDGTLTISGTIEGTVAGSEAGTVAAGGVVGRCEDTDMQLTHLRIDASVKGHNASYTSVGGVLGEFTTEERTGSVDEPYSLIDQVKVTGSLENGTSIGGIVGSVDGHNLRIGDPDSGSVSITGNLNQSNSAISTSVGGVAGLISGQYIEVYHAKVGEGSGNHNWLNQAEAVGGIFGTVGHGEDERTVVKVQDVEIYSSSSNGKDNAQGGIFGRVKPNSMAALDGKIQVEFAYDIFLRITDEYAKTGYVAGEQTEALIYFEKDALNQYSSGGLEITRENNVPAQVSWKDNIGSYGGVYWNRDGALISYADQGVSGLVKKSGSDWRLASEEDVMRLAIALNTEGRFADNCFGGADKGSLLAAGYQLQAGKTYDLKDSGIYDLNRNDAKGKDQVFKGQIHGNGAVLRLDSYDTYQRNIALFPCVGDGAVFEDFTLEGSDGNPRMIKYAKEGAAGLAVYGQNDVTVDKVTVRAGIEGCTFRDMYTRYYYGGMFARFHAGAGTTLKVTDSRLEGNISIPFLSSNLNYKQYVGGLIADYTSGEKATIEINGLTLCQQINSVCRFASGMITQINEQNTNRDKTVLKMSDITFEDGSSLVITDQTNSGGENVGGGLLGRQWFDVAPGEGNFSVRDLTVGTGTGTAPVLDNMGTFGGLVHTVTGRLQLVDTCINGMQITGNNTSNDGLLVNNGYDALIEIDGYKMPSPGNVTISGVHHFSEIVGRNIGTGTEDGSWEDYAHGGIVNIISAEFDSGSQVYKNRAAGADTQSEKVRYYYNLFGTSLSGESSFLSGSQLDGNNLIIKNADQMLIWHLNQYMNDSIRNRYLTPYFTAGVPGQNGNVTISGTIDLTNKSYYPTPVRGGIVLNGGGAAVKFGAAAIVDHADAGRKPSVRGEHYLMHSGLLVSTAGKVTVQGSGTDAPAEGDYFTLTGTITNAKYSGLVDGRIPDANDTGALFVKGITGEKNVYRIKLKDLYIHEYQGDHESGLLISKVRENTTLHMSWIQTEYHNVQTGKKAASALIGRVGWPDNTSDKGTHNISIEFGNMKLDDQRDGIFQNATLIDKYYYTDDTAINKGRVRYLFTEEAAKGTSGAAYNPFSDGIWGHNDYSTCGKYLTLGNELEYGIEYWNKDGEISGELVSSPTEWSKYLPYVCDTEKENEGKDIEVNPKTRKIIEGCGVYEDPYVLNDARQILALSRYLTNKDDKKYLENWQITPIGNNGTFCDIEHTEAGLASYGSAKFPTQNELRQAYYQIASDIDLSKLANTTDRNIAQEFVGLGTEEMPFAGVIVGKKKDDGSVPVITLPKKKKTNYATNFGLIQYAKGAVVKDLEITGNTEADSWDTAGTLTDSIRVKESAGSVFARVLGGDNIIDGVTVSNRITPVSKNAAAGGYVGTLQQGSVLLRHMSEGCVSDFQCMTTAETEINPLPDQDGYSYVSGLIGKVENGFAMYESSHTGSYTGSMVLEHGAAFVSGVYQHRTLPLSQTYDIIVADDSSMQAAKNTPMNITSVSGGFTCTINTSAQLQIVSMAVNSDAFSVYYDGGGYDKKAVCRKAAYDEVGTCDAADFSDAGSDYKKATDKDDNTYWYPYIYRYFTFDGTTAENSNPGSPGSGFYRILENYTAANGYRSQLNAVTKDVTAKMSWKLVNGADDVDYDLSGYSRGFRGLGATYRIFKNDNFKTEDNTTNLTLRENAVFSDFRADFDGNGATVRAEMINDYDSTIHTTAFFNDLVNTDAVNSYSIKNLVLTGEFKNTISENGKGQEKIARNYREERTAALVGMMRRPWTLENITVNDAEISGKGYTAGVVAWISPGDEKPGEAKAYTLKNCEVTSTGGSTTVTTAGGSCGGIVGIMSPAVMLPDNTERFKDISFTLEDCRVSGTNMQPVHITNLGNGMPGMGNSAGTPAANDNDQYRYAKGRTGGLIGFIGKRTDKNNNGQVTYNDSIKVVIDVKITDSGSGSSSAGTTEYVQIDGVDSTGGILGEYFGYSIDTPDNNIGALTGDNQDKVTLTIDSVRISESTITSKNLNETGANNSFGTGGIVGKVGRGTGCSIRKSSVYHSNVRADYYENSDPHPNDGNNKSGIVTNQIVQHAGGAVGSLHHRSRLTLSEVLVEGALDAQGTPLYEISSLTADAGGLLGRNINTNPSNNYQNNNQTETSVTITDCKVSEMKISSDNRTAERKREDKACGTSSRMAGGMIGTIDRATVTIKKTKADPNLIADCVIRTGSSGTVGGVVALVDSRSIYSIAGTKVTDSTIGYNGRLNLNEADDGVGAGGIIGRVSASGNDKTTGTLQDLEVTSCYIIGRRTGGLLGVVHHCEQIGNIWESEEDTILISQNKLLGQYTGGVIGHSANAVHKICFEHVTIEENHILALWSNKSYAGGFCGYQRLDGVSKDSEGNDNQDYHQIAIRKNQIMSCNYSRNHINENQFAGGMFGYIDSGDNRFDLYTYETGLEDNHIGYYTFSGDIDWDCIDAINNQLAVITTRLDAVGSSENTRAHLLLNGNTPTIAFPAAFTSENLAAYAKGFGNLVGCYNGSGMHAYFVKPTITYTNTYEGIRPVVDVGMRYETTAAADDKLLSSPYDYRKNIHVIYYEPDTADNEPADRWDSSNVAASDKDKLFSQIPMEKILQEYVDAAATEQVLDAYRLHLTNDDDVSVETIYSQVYFGEDEDSGVKVYRSPIIANGAELPMIVLDARYGTADQLMSGVLAMLTGTGGVLNSGEKNKNAEYDNGLFKITNIDCSPMKVVNGELKSGDSESLSLICVDEGNLNNLNGHKEFAYTRKFDTANADGGTFTMVTVTYGKETYQPISGAAKCTPQVTIQIPVFVTERLTIDTYVKLVEDAVYNVKDAKQNGIYNHPILATDSSYTMYMEYIYGEARNSFSTDGNPLSIEKTVGITKVIDNQVTNVPFPKGTIFTLIDVCDSDKVYYYEVTGEETGPIPYSGYQDAEGQYHPTFVDAEGNPYVNKPIHGNKGMEVYSGEEKFVSESIVKYPVGDPSDNKVEERVETQEYEDVAVERFLIVVDTSKADKIEEGTGDISDYHVTPVLTDDIAKRTTLTEHTDLNVTIQAGPKIGFADKTGSLLADEDKTKMISGAINAESKLAADGWFMVKAGEEYWDRVLNSEKSIIDSANHGKYLELGLYLTANRNGETVRIPLPDNTNVSISLERVNPLGTVLQPDKNLGSYVNETAVYLYKDGKLTFPLDELKYLIQDEINDKGITNGEVTIGFKINLDFELADLTEYTDETYGVYLDLLRIEDPAYPAGGEIIDEGIGSCPGAKQSDIACALETKDLMQLGINTYDNQAKEEELINFRFKLDFTGIWTKNEEANQKIAARYYTVTYRILEKTNRNGKPEYKPYTGRNLEITLVDSPGGEQLQKGPSSSGTEINSSYVTYHFDYDEIKDGTESKDADGRKNQIPCMITRDLQLKVKHAADMDLTNYKIQASVGVADSDKVPEDIEEAVSALSDFFVFTIGRLKTDLDY